MSDEKKPRRPVDDVRNELLNDPDVKEQAKILNVPLEAYVDKILDYAAHPDKPPELQIVADDVLKKQDPTIPTVAEAENHLQRMIRGELPLTGGGVMGDGFSKGPTASQYGKALGSEASVKYEVPDQSETSQEIAASIQKPKPKFKG